MCETQSALHSKTFVNFKNQDENDLLTFKHLFYLNGWIIKANQLFWIIMDCCFVF